MKILSLFLVLLALAACSFAPLRPTVDLLERLPGQTSGSFVLDTSAATLDLLPLLETTEGDFRQNLPAGSSSPLSLTLPSPAGQFIDLRTEPLPVTLEGATLRYALALTSENLEGEVTVQPFLAPQGTDAVDSPAYALGEPQRVTLGETNTLQADVTLNEAQLEGVNDRRLRLALRISGEAGVATSGEVRLGYEFSELSLEISSLGAGADARLPDADGEVLDFSDTEVPGPGRLIGATLDYDITLSHDADASGTLLAEIYVAPPGDDSLWREEYLFDSVSLDLLQKQANVAGRASLNEAQRPLLREQRLRIGVRVSGDAALEVGDTITVTYELNQLDLTVDYAL